MASHEVNDQSAASSAPGIDLGGFHWQSVDEKLNASAGDESQHQISAMREIGSQRVVAPASRAAAVATTPPAPPLGTVKAFSGTFVGRGLNLIFRPRSDKFNTFPTKPATESHGFPADNVLELNLTQETLSFSQPLGSVPNRGLAAQDDIFLNGVTYLQLIDDITDPATGKANPAKPASIHAEPGVWMHVPPSRTNPVLGASLCRMASIPHGTTINAQCLDTPTVTNGPPTIGVRDPQPFAIGQPSGTKFPFDSLDVTKQDTARIPQDLSLFSRAGTITAETMRDLNSVLRDHIKGQKITRASTFTVSTHPKNPHFAGGTANIGFLRGDGITANGTTTFSTPNADAVKMDAQFWIETVETTVRVPALKAGQQPARLVPDKGPLVVVDPPAQGAVAAREEKVTFTQIQYSQLVLLDFGGLSWPHISVATLVPKEVRLES